MNRNFEIVDGIYLVHKNYELDLHNNFVFKKMDYSVAERKLILYWQRSEGDWVSLETPKMLTIEFNEVSEFRFMPRDPKVPFTEDDCLDSFGYWVDEDWAEGVMLVAPDQRVEPEWLTAIDFMSGAILAVQAANGYAEVVV